jgi:hypothetical protein
MLKVGSRYVSRRNLLFALIVIVILIASAIGIKIFVRPVSTSVSYTIPTTGLGNILFGCDCVSAVKHFTPQQFAQIVGTTRVALGESVDSQTYSQAGFTDVQTLTMPSFSQPAGCGNGNNADQCYWSLSDWDGNVTQEVSTHTWVKYWQIWNEPQNFAQYDDGYLGGCAPGQITCIYSLAVSTAHYAQMSEDAYKIIHHYVPNATVIDFGGDNIFSCSGDTCNNDPSNVQWAQDVWTDLGCSVGSCQYADAIGLHAYSSEMLLSTSVYDSTDGNTETISQAFASSMHAYVQDFGLPIYITETGIMSNCQSNPSCGRSTQTQATYLGQAFSLFATIPQIKMVLWYNDIGQNYCSNGGSYCDFGLWTSVWQPKASFDVWDNFLKSSAAATTTS